jgi:hypothetical protein
MFPTTVSGVSNIAHSFLVTAVPLMAVPPVLRPFSTG